MESVDQPAWEAAVRRIFEDKYSFVATGPRTRQEWSHDVLAVMCREAGDPRGWLTLDWDESVAGPGTENPMLPFTNVRAPAMRNTLWEIAPGSARQLLVAMMDDACDVRGLYRFEEERDELLANADTILARYGPDITCYTNLSKAQVDRELDVFAGSVGWHSFTDYTGDFGLVVVSPGEVGVFWSFWPD